MANSKSRSTVQPEPGNLLPMLEPQIAQSSALSRLAITCQKQAQEQQDQPQETATLVGNRIPACRKSKSAPLPDENPRTPDSRKDGNECGLLPSSSRALR